MTSRISRWLLARAGFLARGATLHRAALAAAHAGETRDAETLFERAVRAYRRDLDVEALARLRIHQSMAALRGVPLASDEASARGAEVDRRLARIDAIERPEPPFDSMPAVDLIASWHPGAGEPMIDARRAA